MAQSNSYDFTLNRKAIITKACEEVGALDLAGTLDDDLNTFCSDQLNMMLKNWAGMGLNLWRLKEFVLLLVKDQVEYKLGDLSTSDHFLLQADLNETFINGDQTVDTTTNSTLVDGSDAMAVGDNLVVELEAAGTVLSTTVASIADSTHFAPTAAYTDDIDDNDIVYTYTNKLVRPLYLVNCWRRARSTAATGLQGADTPVHIFSRERYYNLGDKRSESEVVEVYYDPQVSGAAPHEGTLRVYPEPRDVGIRLMGVCAIPWQDMDDDTDNIGAGSEWLLPITLGLGLRLCNSQGVSIQRKREIKVDFTEALDNAYSVDHEHGERAGPQIVPDYEE